LSLYRWLVFNLALANDRANWPAVDLAIELPGAATLAAVTRESVLSAGEALGLPRRLSERELDRLTRGLLPAVSALEQRIEHENAGYPPPVHIFLGGERRLVSTISHIIVRDMLERLGAAH
jgi:serine/threonine-protein kinase HipA